MFVKERAPFASNNKKVTKQDPHPPNSSSSVGGGRSRGEVTSIVREPLRERERARAIVVPSERDRNRPPPPSRFDPRIRIRSGTRKSRGAGGRSHFRSTGQTLLPFEVSIRSYRHIAVSFCKVSLPKNGNALHRRF